MKWPAAPCPLPSRKRIPPHWFGWLLGCVLVAAVSPLAAQPLAPPPATDPVDVYLAAIERAESTGGAYATELVDLYYGLGQTLLEQGDLEWARDAFHQTVMVARVNSGPYSVKQASYLYSVADIESRLGNPAAAIEVLNHIYVIFTRHHGEENPALLGDVEDLYDWYLDRLSVEGAPVGPSDFENLSFLMERIAALTEARYGLGHALTASRYRELGQLHYQAIHHFIQTGQPPIPELVMQSEGSGNQALRERSTINHLERGEEAFERAVQARQENPDGTELELAEAMAQLGDWYLAFKYFRKARRQYEQAYRLLANQPEYRNLADQYLGTPAPLRFLNAAEPFVRNLEPPAAGRRLEVSMAVSLTGRLYDIEIVKAPDALSKDQLRAVKQHLESTRFRPAVVNGKSQSVQGFVFKALADEPEAAAING